jgi:YHS domain-containing protein
MIINRCPVCGNPIRKAFIGDYKGRFVMFCSETCRNFEKIEDSISPESKIAKSMTEFCRHNY